MKVSVLYSDGSKTLWNFHTGQKPQAKPSYCHYLQLPLSVKTTCEQNSSLQDYLEASLVLQYKLLRLT